jgi:hypothetical protein
MRGIIMGIIKKPESVKLFAGVIAVSSVLAEQALGKFSENFGEIDYRSPKIDFCFTDYYRNEMGENLCRYWVSFKELIDPSALAQAKISANKIEEIFKDSGKRQVNIDPGYITPAKVVLASSKDFSHRIYLRDGIYGEVTLMYKHKDFSPLQWTYPDYQSKTAYDFFRGIREILCQSKQP